MTHALETGENPRKAGHPSVTTGKHAAAMAEAAASPKPEGWKFRDRDAILKCLEVGGVAPFTAAHPTLGLGWRIKGPFSTAKEMNEECSAWSHDAAVQPLGVFRCRLDGARTAHPKRGRRCFVRCSRGQTQKLACPFKHSSTPRKSGKASSQSRLVTCRSFPRY